MTCINKLGSDNMKESDKVCANIKSENGIRFLVDTSDIPSREAEEDPMVGTPPPLSTKSLSERHSKVHGENLCILKKIWQAPLHYRALQFLINLVVPESPSRTEQATVKFNANLNLAKSDLTWWISLDRKVPIQSSILPRTPSMTIESDAAILRDCQGIH